MQAGASKFGACDICHENPTETFYQSEEKYYKHSTGIRKEGWTHHNCVTRFGHEKCLKSVRRGDYVFTVREDKNELDVYEEK